eukprot:CAMPEP_0182567802 /NCGR_PEP_ID=MMETSP1324-20130603/8915_1 /TAXON_ID=236786 /ORGANISM="Florenciella sp., Strain RCC1587" /LENGTH=3423 /DNA_ID=CAMNT_0024781849 /DNA_START=15 /DNA_END=10286 /DNA_ORIENTATION=+
MSSMDDFRLELSKATKLAINDETLSAGLVKLIEYGYSTWPCLMDLDQNEDNIKQDLVDAGFLRTHANLIISCRSRQSANGSMTVTPVATVAGVPSGHHSPRGSYMVVDGIGEYLSSNEYAQESPYSDITSDGTRTPPSAVRALSNLLLSGAAEEQSVTRSVTSNKSIKPLNTKEVVNIVKKNSLKVNLAGNKAIFTIGVTGSGKTTTILHLNGCSIQLHQVPEGRHGQTKDVLVCTDRPDGYEIGGGANACTTLLRATTLPSGNGVLVDTPGSEDTEGIELDVANCISITKAVKTAASASFLWVISAKHLTGKASMFRMNFKTILRFMPTAHMDGVAESIVPLFTGVENWGSVATNLDGILKQTHTSTDEDRPSFINKLLKSWNNDHRTQANAEAWKKALPEIEEGVRRILHCLEGPGDSSDDGILNNALEWFLKALDETELPDDIRETIEGEAASLAIMGRLYSCLEEHKNNLCIPLSTFREGREQIASEKRMRLLEILDQVEAIDDPQFTLRSPLGPSSCGQIKAATERMVNEVNDKLGQVDRSIEWVLDGEDLGLTEVLALLFFFADSLDLTDVFNDMQRAAIDLQSFGADKCDEVCDRLVDTFTEQDASVVRTLMLQCRGICNGALWPASDGLPPEKLTDKLEASWHAINGAVGRQLSIFDQTFGADTSTLVCNTHLGDEVGYWKSRMNEVSEVLYKLREFAKLKPLGYLENTECYNDTQRKLHKFVLEVEAFAAEKLDGKEYNDLVKCALASLQATELSLTTREGDGHIDNLQRTATYSQLCKRLDADVKDLIQSLVSLVRSGEIFDPAQRERAVSMYNLIQDAVQHLAIHRLHPPAHTPPSVYFEGTAAEAEVEAEVNIEVDVDQPSDSASASGYAQQTPSNVVLMTAATGTMVRLVGLTKRCGDNGKEGTVCAADHVDGQLHIQLADGNTLSIKPANLELISQATLVDFVTEWEQARPEIVSLKDTTFGELKEQLTNQDWASWVKAYDRTEYLYNMIDDPLDALDVMRNETVKAVVRISDEICTMVDNGLVERDFDGDDGDPGEDTEYFAERVDFGKLGDARRNLGVAVEYIVPLLKSRKDHWQNQVAQVEGCDQQATERIQVLGHALCRFIKNSVGWDVSNRTKFAPFNSHGVACGLRELQHFRGQKLAAIEENDGLEAASTSAVASLISLGADWCAVLERRRAAVATEAAEAEAEAEGGAKVTRKKKKKRKGTKEVAPFDVGLENTNANKSRSPSPTSASGLSAPSGPNGSNGPKGEALNAQIDQLRKLFDAPKQLLSVLTDVQSLTGSQELAQIIKSGSGINQLFARVETNQLNADDATPGATPGAQLLGICTDRAERVQGLVTDQAAEAVDLVRELLSCLKGGKDKRRMREEARRAMDDVRLLNDMLYRCECLDDVLEATPIATARQDLTREVGATFKAIRKHCENKIAEKEFALKPDSTTLDATGALILLTEMASTPEGMDAKFNTAGDDGPTPTHLVHELEVKIKLANKDFLEDVQECLATQRWDDLATLLRQNSGHAAGEEKVKFDRMVSQVHSHFKARKETGNAFMDDIINSLGLQEPSVQSIGEVADVLGCLYKSSPLWALGDQVKVRELQMRDWYEGLKTKLMDGFIHHCADTARARCDVIKGDQFRFDDAFDSFRHLRLMAGERRFPEPVRTEIREMAGTLEEHLEVHVNAIEKRAGDLTTDGSERSVRCLRTLMDSIRSMRSNNYDVLVRMAGNASVLESLKEILRNSLESATEEGVKHYNGRDIGSGDQCRKKLKRTVRYLNKEDFPEEVEQWEEDISHAREDALEAISKLDSIGSIVTHEFMYGTNGIKQTIAKREFDKVVADLSQEFKEKVDEAVKGYLPGNEILEMTADEIGRIPVVIQMYGKIGKVVEVDDITKFHEPLNEVIRRFNRACAVAFSSLNSTLASVTGTKLDKPRRQRRGAGRQSWHLDDPFEAKDFLEMNVLTLQMLSSKETQSSIKGTFAEGSDAMGRVHRLLEEAHALEPQVSSLLDNLPNIGGDLNAAYKRCMELFTVNFGRIGEKQTIEIHDTLKKLSDDNSLAAIGFDDDLSHEKLSTAFKCAVETSAIEARLRELLEPVTDRVEVFAASEPEPFNPHTHGDSPFGRCSVADILGALKHLVNVGHGQLGEEAKKSLHSAKSVCIDLFQDKMATGANAYRDMVNEEDDTESLRKDRLRTIRNCQKWLRTYEKHVAAIVENPSDSVSLISMIIDQVTEDATKIKGSAMDFALRGQLGGREISEKLTRLNRAAMELTDEKELFEHTRDQICKIIDTYVKCCSESATDDKTRKAMMYDAVQLLWESLQETARGSEIIQEQGIFKQHLRAAWKKTASLQWPTVIESTFPKLLATVLGEHALGSTEIKLAESTIAHKGDVVKGEGIAEDTTVKEDLLSGTILVLTKPTTAAIADGAELSITDHVVYDTVAKLNKCYHKLMEKFQQIVEDPATRNEARVRSIASHAIEDFRREHVKDEDAQMHSVPLLLARIFAVWSVGTFLEESKSSMVKPDFLYPLPSQILCLFQMLQVTEGCRLIPKETGSHGLGAKAKKILEWGCDKLTGTRYTAPPIRSSVCRIKTGQGKSLVIAAEAIVLAVATGLPVDVACYSPYLSQRDFAAFEFVFEAFGVADKISYGTFQQCAETHGRGPVVRELTRQLIMRSPSSASGLSDAAADAETSPQRILIVDEYDTLLKEDTYGEDMVLDANLPSDEVVTLMNETWGLLKGAAETVEASELSAQVKALPAYAALMALYHEDARPLIAREIRSMVGSAAQFDAVIHGKECPYVVQLDDEGHPAIAYKYGDDYTTKRSFGYDTVWLQFHERDEAQAGEALTITDESMRHTLSLSMPCGSFSYAKLASAYGLVLGVSGTLPAPGSVEREICQDFGIEAFYEMVDIYNNKNSENVFNRSSTGPERGVILENNLVSQHNRIAQILNATANTQQRPVLVYFQTEAALREFKKSGDYITNFPPDGDVQVEEIVPSQMEEGYMEGMLRFAVGKQHVTLLTADHTRGLDMVVMDPEVKEKGLHVIMTYFSLDKTEEIQAMGRTARQSDNGSFALVLDQSAVLQMFEGTTLDQASLEAHREAGTAYQHLDELRHTKYGDLCQERRENVLAGASATRHQESTAYREALVAYQKAPSGGGLRADCLSKLKNISNSLSPGAGSSRIVRVAIIADATGSMGGIWSSGLPDVVLKAIERISAVAGEQGGAVFKIAAYFDYDQLPHGGTVTKSSEWAGQDTAGKGALERFIKSIRVSGGTCHGERGPGGPEAVEAGLKMIGDEVEGGDGEPVDLVVLLADAPPHPHKKGEALEVTSKYTHTMETDYRTESTRLAGQGTRMLCGYYRSSAKESFTEMATLTKGEAFNIKSDMASDASSEVIANVVCPRVLEIIGGADMVNEYNKQYNKALWRG